MPTKPPGMTWDHIEERVRARVEVFSPMTPAQRLVAMKEQGFFPNGIYVPSAQEIRKYVLSTLKDVGDFDDVDDRQRRYAELQSIGEQMQTEGIPGRWTSQQALCRSLARFRLVAWGRRSGKTTYAAQEGTAHARTRPRSTVWVCAPTMKLVGRCFDKIDEIIADLRLEVVIRRSTEQTRLIVLGNGSRIEGVSLDKIGSVAGAGVDLAIVDEAAQIDRPAFERGILPPLADRNGSALLISSWEGEDDFFHTKAIEASREEDWEVFQEATWDANFTLFPQGRDSTSIKAQERSMQPVEFLEQFGAIPTRSKTKVFPEFNEKVHVGDWPFNPDHPVILGVDPSGGANAYGILVVQDYKDYFVVIDEFYEIRVTAAEISPLFDKKPWRGNVTDMVVDSAAFTETEHWQRLGWPAYPVHEKPPVEERLPLYRNMLRDPDAYHMLYRRVVNEILAEKDLPPNYDMVLPADQQRLLAVTVEDRLSDKLISDEDQEVLRRCARIFVDRRCYHTIQEHKLYKYVRSTKGGNMKEIPSDSDNHLLDAGGYLVWTFHRFDENMIGPPPYQRTSLVGGAALPKQISLPRDLVPQAAPPRPSFVARMRALHDSSGRSSYARTLRRR